MAAALSRRHGFEAPVGAEPGECAGPDVEMEAVQRQQQFQMRITRIYLSDPPRQGGPPNGHRHNPKRIQSATVHTIRQVRRPWVTNSTGGATRSTIRLPDERPGCLIEALRAVYAGLPDRCKGPREVGQYSMADFGLSAFSVFFLGSR
jgi:hypothetical protein